MPYTPFGSLAVRYELIMRTLAYSARFRDLIESESDDEDLALTRIIMVDQADDMVSPTDARLGHATPRTRAILDLAEDQWALVPNGRGLHNESLPIWMRLEITIPEIYQGTEIRGTGKIEKLWCEDMWRTIVKEMLEAARLHFHPTSGLPFIADTVDFSCIARDRIDVSLADDDLALERFYAVELILSDSCGS